MPPSRANTGVPGMLTITMPCMRAPANLSLASKLPHVGTTIFTTMSALAQQHGAINLGQGFPDFDCDAALVEQVAQAMRAGHNQYPPMAGVPALRQAVAEKVAADYGASYDWQDEITITAGATQALLTALLALVRTGDEVILLDPCYDSYEPGVLLAGGVPQRVALRREDFRPDFAALRKAINPRTRAILLNNPHNPGAATWTADDMRQLVALLQDTSIVLIADEVYEHMVYDGVRFESVTRHPALRERAVVVSSFGKTYHVTGWKVGYALAPAALMQEFRKVHQFNVFTVNSAMQVGLAAYLRQSQAHRQLAAFYQAKRDRFRAGLASTRFKLLPCSGSYFQCVDYSGLNNPANRLPEPAFCEWLTREVGVAAIPLSVFYGDGRDQHLARFCFAKRDETLDAALQRLAQL